MLISYWDGEDLVWDAGSSRIRDQVESHIINNMLKKSGKDAVWLSTIEIETINRCNNDCSFCPANRNRDVRQPQKMEESLFKKIIDELAEMHYSGRVDLFSNDEPLLDDRIFDFLQYAAEKLPDAYHSLFTNGILLNEEKLDRLTEYLDYLRINNYNDNLELNSNILELTQKDVDEKNCLIEIEVRKKTQKLLNRGGLSPNNESSSSYKSACILPFIQMVIRPDGSVSRCCQDVYGNETFGNVKEQTIKEVWYGPKLTAFRQKMTAGERDSIPFCRDCDLCGLVNRYPSRWETDYLEEILCTVQEKASAGEKILLWNMKNVDAMVCALHLHGYMDMEVSDLPEDLETYFKCGYFVILGSLTPAVQNIIEQNGRLPGVHYLLYDKDLHNLVQFNRKKDRSEIRSKIKEASKEGRLVVFGAGVTAKRIVSALELDQYVVVDNDHVDGQLFAGKEIESPEIVSTITDPLVLTASFDFVEIVKQLNGYGLSSRNIILGHKLLR